MLAALEPGSRRPMTGHVGGHGMVWIFRLFAAFYLGALAYYLAESLGMTGHGGDKLATQVIHVIGLPWNLLFREADAWVTVLVDLLSPAINLGIVWILADIIQGRED